MRDVVYHKLPYCETSSQFKFKLNSSVPDAMLNNPCDVRINFLSVMEFISNFEDTSANHASIIEFFSDKGQQSQLSF